MLIDFVPTVDGVSLDEATTFKKAPGGAPANVAVGISRLGGSSAFIGKVGEDEFGYMLANILKETTLTTGVCDLTLVQELHWRLLLSGLMISEDEITFLTGGDDPYDDKVVLENLFHPNLKILIVTEGSEGCRYYTKEFKGQVTGVKVKPVDTTGAGDAFVSGILKSLASDLNVFEDEMRLREALLFANVCGALTVTERGAIPALPTEEAVLSFLT